MFGCKEKAELCKRDTEYKIKIQETTVCAVNGTRAQADF
jgi:hypothetical protein